MAMFVCKRTCYWNGRLYQGIDVAANPEVVNTDKCPNKHFIPFKQKEEVAVAPVAPSRNVDQYADKGSGDPTRPVTIADAGKLGLLG